MGVLSRMAGLGLGLGLTLGLGAALVAGSAAAQDADTVVKFGMPQDFTAVYTFVTSEYNQGQRDYLSLVNGRGGVGGVTFEALVLDHGNQPQRGIEAYERLKKAGVLTVDALSTPVSRALVPRAMADHMNLLTTFSGRSDAADGTTFPWVIPMSPMYWSQAAAVVSYMNQASEGGLKGKKLAYVYIDSPFGREPLPVLNALAEADGFELGTFPYPSPGSEQSAVWTQVRRFRPDWTIIWGGGIGQTVALREAVRNGIPRDRLATGVWLSESDAEIVGREQAKGVLKFEAVASGREPKIIADILAEVVAKGKGAGPEEKVGTAYYNMGVGMMAMVVEGVRLALAADPTLPLTAERLNAGLTSIRDFDAEGLLPPTTLTPEDHQGGGAGRMAAWDGTRWVAKTDWFAAHQDLVWKLVRAEAEHYRKTGE
ncbi:ABC transporter substrate-binding protein [uncultured Tistrella sp.]|uniref:ABC transporter substrate-binding protein n=1 Tax=Tistrella mobilis TaxID=171437 RepID=UPI000C0B26D5|nr:ABC transporter substrate-binding protein [uncultured Tistrella sp.]MAM76963.1 ABC transporter substrate-binding protein [Tistrella sp.]